MSQQEKPIYEQLMDVIKRKISSGEYKVGDKLDSERIMSEQYGINRMTVRNAIKKLEKEGVVETIKNSGSYVKLVPKINDKIELGNSSIQSLSFQIRQKGMKSSRQTLSLKKVKTSGELKKCFPNDKEVYEIIRLSLINDNPYALQKVYIPCSIFKLAERFDFETFSLYDYMDDQGHRPKSMVSNLEIASIEDKYCDIMKVKKNKKIFFFTYVGYDKDEQLVEYTLSYHLPEYTTFKYVASIK